MKKLIIQNQATLKETREEAERLESVIQHPNIIRMTGFCETMPAIVTEYAQHGSLIDFRLKNQSNPFTVLQLIEVNKQTNK